MKTIVMFFIIAIFNTYELKTQNYSNLENHGSKSDNDEIDLSVGGGFIKYDNSYPFLFSIKLGFKIESNYFITAGLDMPVKILSLPGIFTTINYRKEIGKTGFFYGGLGIYIIKKYLGALFDTGIDFNISKNFLIGLEFKLPIRIAGDAAWGSFMVLSNVTFVF